MEHPQKLIKHYGRNIVFIPVAVGINVAKAGQPES